MGRCTGLIATVFGLGVLLAACGGENETSRPADPNALTEEVLRSILPAAASMDPQVLHVVVSLGAKVLPGDVEHACSLPLLAMVAYRTGGWPPGLEEEFRWAPTATPATVLPLLWGGVEPGTVGARPTLLTSEYVTSVTIEQEGDSARGVVAFHAEDGYEGRVHYEATRTGETWWVTAFEFPLRDARMEWTGSEWKLARLAPHGPPVELVRVPEADVPSDPLSMRAVHLLPTGDVWVAGKIAPLAVGSPDEQAENLAAIRGWLREVAADTQGESEGLTAVIVADVAARWQYAYWLLELLREVGFARVVVAVRGAADGRVGVLTFDALSEESDSDGPGVTLKLFRRDPELPDRAFTRVRVAPDVTFELPRGWPPSHSWPVDRTPYESVIEQVQAAVAEQIGLMGDQAAHAFGEIRTPPPFGLRVPYEDVVRMITVLRAAGITSIRLQAVAPPPSRSR